MGKYSRRYIYIMDLGFDGLYKIGMSTNPKRRLRALQSGNPKMKLVLFIKVRASTVTERHLHRSFENRRFDRELFHLTHEDIMKIETYLTRIKNMSMKKRKKGKIEVNTILNSPIRTLPLPYCSECGAKMTLRRPRKDQSWDTFWGCSQYPDCKGTRGIQPNGRPEEDTS